jgi:GT2 family glycosyltransferase
MIAFAVSITKEREYDRIAKPGIDRAAEPDSQILAYGSAGSIFRSYNVLLEQAAQLDDLEALVILHQDTELVDDDFCSKIRRALSDPDVAIVGCAGAIDVRSIAYWEGSVTWGSFAHRYSEYGGGEIPALTWDLTDAPAYAHTGEVDSIDGFAMALSPWVVRELRFDESLGQIHGYDFDICLQARAKGKKVVTSDFRAIHHHSLELIRDSESWIQAHMRIAEKWHDTMPAVGYVPGEDWKYRARRAEAEAAAARKMAGAAGLVRDAKVRELRRELYSVERSWSWRLTAPLRAIATLFGRRPPVHRLTRPDAEERPGSPAAIPPGRGAGAAAKAPPPK